MNIPPNEWRHIDPKDGELWRRFILRYRFKWLSSVFWLLLIIVLTVCCLYAMWTIAHDPNFSDFLSHIMDHGPACATREAAGNGLCL